MQARQSESENLTRLANTQQVTRQETRNCLRLPRPGDCRECAKQDCEEGHKRDEGEGQGGNEHDDCQLPSNFSQTYNETKRLDVPQQLQLTDGQNKSPEVNTFIEQLISDRLKDLVTVQPDGGIKLNMCEQLSAIL